MLTKYAALLLTTIAVGGTDQSRWIQSFCSIFRRLRTLTVQQPCGSKLLLIFSFCIRLNYSCASKNAIRRCIFTTLYSKDSGCWNCETAVPVRRSPRIYPSKFSGETFLNPRVRDALRNMQRIRRAPFDYCVP